MGHRVAVLKDGILQQVDRPRTLYSHPVNLFVAGFIGSPAMNLVEVSSGGTDGLRLGSLSLPLDQQTTHDLAARGPGACTVGVRPEHLQLANEGIAGEVTVVEELGSESYVHIAVEHQGGPLLLVVRAEGETTTQRGDNVQVSCRGPVHVFAPNGERIGAQ